MTAHKNVMKFIRLWRLLMAMPKASRVRVVAGLVARRTATHRKKKNERASEPVGEGEGMYRVRVKKKTDMRTTGYCHAVENESKSAPLSPSIDSAAR